MSLDRRYKLRAKYGIITHLYPTGQLNSVPTELQEELKKEILAGSKEEHPLRTIAIFASTADRVGISCNCKKKCTKTCRCQKNGVACSIYCHAVEELDCGNFSKLTERTELALVNRSKTVVSTSNTIGDSSFNTKKRARATTTTTQKPVVKRPRELKNQQQNINPRSAIPGRRTRAQQQTTLSQYEGMKPIVNRLSNIKHNETTALEVPSSSSLSDLEDVEYSE